jgi:hypothetical protein
MTTRFGARAILAWLTVVLVTVPVAAWAFAQAATDWRYELAGLANPFLGRPAPALTVVLGLMGTGLLAIVVRAARWIVRHSRWRSEARGAPRGLTPIRPRWWIPLAGGWAAYALGAAIVVAAGGPRTYEATVRYAFGPPIGATIEVPATCRSPVGRPDLIAEIDPDARGLLRLGLLDRATGRLHWSQALVGLRDRAAKTAYPLPNVPARSLPYLFVTMGDGTTFTEPPIGFLGAYGYEVTHIDAPAMAGDAHVVGTRFRDRAGGLDGPRWVDLEIPDDPWPQTLEVVVSWTCRP